MSYQNFAEAYIQPQYTSLMPECKDISNNFPQELQLFLAQYPEFTKDPSHLQFLQYCFDNYINMDPISRGLPIQEKLKQAGEMANNFMGIVIGAKNSSVTAYPLMRN